MLKDKALSLFPTDVLVGHLLRLTAVTSAIIVLMVFSFLITEIIEFRDVAKSVRFFTDARWNPTESQLNLLPMVFATIAVAIGAIVVAVPIGILSALFLNLYAPRPLQVFYRRLIELLAGIPSVIYGFWGLTVLVPLVDRWASPGASLFTASIVLALMVLPTSALMIDVSFQSVSPRLVNGVKSLGIGKWGVFTLALLPSNFSTLATASLLSLGRSIGETMAVMMVCGNIVQFPSGVFDPVRTLTSNIALELGYAEGIHREALFVSGFVLMVLIVILMGFATYVERKYSRI